METSTASAIAVEVQLFLAGWRRWPAIERRVKDLIQT